MCLYKPTLQQHKQSVCLQLPLLLLALIVYFWQVLQYGLKYQFCKIVINQVRLSMCVPLLYDHESAGAL